MSILLDDSHVLLCQALRKYLEGEIRTLVLWGEEHHQFPREIARKLGEQGYIGVTN